MFIYLFYFFIQQYIGTWYQIEGYPHELETANCSGMRYTVNDAEDKIKLLKWQVDVDGELDIIEGNATVVPSENNEARFIIELPSRRPEDADEDEDDGIGKKMLFIKKIKIKFKARRVAPKNCSAACIAVVGPEPRFAGRKIPYYG